ncbi:putative signal peptide protein [Puccinia sorghi]|uniref:Putative signal peptide protein n=1 Tax=Puccinia sorghi TaxID=27349 RepID=A0A0L6UVB5_9BASI|nr:putative signal peptide protein [Puccinia sorghi]
MQHVNCRQLSKFFVAVVRLHLMAVREVLPRNSPEGGVEESFSFLLLGCKCLGDWSSKNPTARVFDGCHSPRPSRGPRIGRTRHTQAHKPEDLTVQVLQDETQSQTSQCVHYQGQEFKNDFGYGADDNLQHARSSVRRFYHHLPGTSSFSYTSPTIYLSFRVCVGSGCLRLTPAGLLSLDARAMLREKNWSDNTYWVSLLVRLDPFSPCILKLLKKITRPNAFFLSSSGCLKYVSRHTTPCNFFPFVTRRLQSSPPAEMMPKTFSSPRHFPRSWSLRVPEKTGGLDIRMQRRAGLERCYWDLVCNWLIDTQDKQWPRVCACLYLANHHLYPTFYGPHHLPLGAVRGVTYAHRLIWHFSNYTNKLPQCCMSLGILMLDRASCLNRGDVQITSFLVIKLKRFLQSLEPIDIHAPQSNFHPHKTSQALPTNHSAPATKIILHAFIANTILLFLLQHSFLIIY